MINIGDAFFEYLNSILETATRYGGDLGGPYFVEEYKTELTKELFELLHWLGKTKEYTVATENDFFRIVKPVKDPIKANCREVTVSKELMKEYDEMVQKHVDDLLKRHTSNNEESYSEEDNK
nr:hypothetical protein [Clostridium sp. Marseille-P7770]